MSFSTIRKATETDITRLAAAAARFEARYGLEPDGLDSLEKDGFGLVARWIPQSNGGYELSRLKAAWRKAVHRALDCAADGIAYGYVGFHVD